MTGGQHDDPTLARRRFEAELAVFKSEFETLTSEVDDTDPPVWVSRGSDLLDEAERALEQGQIEQGWVYLHTAQRLSLHRFDSDADADTLVGEAEELVEGSC